jgi:hypothetical protein
MNGPFFRQHIVNLLVGLGMTFSAARAYAIGLAFSSKNKEALAGALQRLSMEEDAALGVAEMVALLAPVATDQYEWLKDNEAGVGDVVVTAANIYAPGGETVEYTPENGAKALNDLRVAFMAATDVEPETLLEIGIGERAQHNLTFKVDKDGYHGKAHPWGDNEGEHAVFTRYDWRQAVAQQTTVEGYEDWVFRQVADALSNGK